MNGREKSDSAIVAGKPTNGARRLAEEPAEPRAGAKGNVGQQSACRAQNRGSVSQALDRIRRRAAAPRRHHLRQEPYAGCERKAGVSLPVKVWSVQSRAGGTGASLAGVAATRGPKRRQRLDGVWN